MVIAPGANKLFGIMVSLIPQLIEPPGHEVLRERHLADLGNAILPVVIAAQGSHQTILSTQSETIRYNISLYYIQRGNSGKDVIVHVVFSKGRKDEAPDRSSVIMMGAASPCLDVY